MASTANTPRSRQLGAELREARKLAGLTTHQLGYQLGRSHTHISRWENGKLTPSEGDTGAVLGILGVTGGERDRLLDLARDAGDPNWIAPGINRQLAGLVDYERTARTITDVQPLLMPGLLQTADYARSIMVGAGATQGEADQRAKYRVGRREVLTKRSAARYVAFIGEYALKHPPCDRDTMSDQLRQLDELTALDNVTIRILPMDHMYHPALEGPFVLIEFTRQDPVVHLEHYRSSATITDAGDIQDYQSAADSLRSVAMSPEASSELIAKFANEMEHTT